MSKERYKKFEYSTTIFFKIIHGIVPILYETKYQLQKTMFGLWQKIEKDKGETLSEMLSLLRKIAKMERSPKASHKKSLYVFFDTI